MTKRKSPDFSDFLERLQQFVRRRGQRTVGAARACESGGTRRVWRDPQRATTSSAIGNFARQKAVNEWSQALSNLLFTVGHGSFYFKLLITSWCFGLLFFFLCIIMRSEWFQQKDLRVLESSVSCLVCWGTALFLSGIHPLGALLRSYDPPADGCLVSAVKPSFHEEWLKD